MIASIAHAIAPGQCSLFTPPGAIDFAPAARRGGYTSHFRYSLKLKDDLNPNISY
jgi:hypothetical protein